MIVKNRYIKSSLATSLAVATLTLTGCNVSDEDIAEYIASNNEQTLVETCQKYQDKCLSFLSKEANRKSLTPRQISALCLASDSLCRLATPPMQKIVKKVHKPLVKKVTYPSFEQRFNQITSQKDEYQQIQGLKKLKKERLNIELTTPQKIRTAAALTILSLRNNEPYQEYIEDLVIQDDSTFLSKPIQAMVYWASEMNSSINTSTNKKPQVFVVVKNAVDKIYQQYSYKMDYLEDLELAEGYLAAATWEHFKGNKKLAARYGLSSIDTQKLSRKFIPGLLTHNGEMDLTKIFLSRMNTIFDLEQIFKA